MTLNYVIERLNSLKNPEKAVFKEKKFNIAAKNVLGIYMSDLNMLAREIGKDNELANKLFDSGIYEGRILCSKLYKPKDVTPDLMEKWVRTFENWEICDSFSMGLFAKSPFAIEKINEWSSRKEEFEKRASFATMAGYCMADKKANNEVFEKFFPLIEIASDDERLYVKKAVNWALRSIGKRNKDLQKRAIAVAESILEKDNKAAQWIAKDALRELKGEKVNVLDYPRSVYRKTNQ